MTTTGTPPSRRTYYDQVSVAKPCLQSHSCSDAVFIDPTQRDKHEHRSR
jgi:hypothetical protein